MKASGSGSPPAPTATRWHSISAEEAAERIGTDLQRGLSAGEASRRLAKWGPNRLAEGRGRSNLRILADQFANLLVVVLVAAAVMAAALGDAADAAAILAIVAANAVVGFLQERRAAGAMAALRRMTAPSARVRRDGAPGILPAAELVPGDIVILEAGDQVPADLRLARAAGLRTVEATLTGESEPSEKEAEAALPAATPVGDRRNMVYAGTIAVAGSAEAVVVATGARTEFGRIAEIVRSTRDEETPLQTRLRVFGRWLVAGCGAVVAMVFALGLLRGIPLFEMLLTSVSLGVAAVPEGLPAVVTVALALGVQRMARRRALVRRLASVETLGCTTVICADKTGTLTLGEMSVREVRAAGSSPGTEGVRRVLWAAAASSTARLVRREGRVRVAGDPTEGALLVAAGEAGIGPGEIDLSEPLESTEPFDSGRKMMSVVRRVGGGLRSYVKGAPETVLPLCLLGAEDRARWEGVNEGMTSRGLRVLAVASKESGEDPERDLDFLGLAGLQDPPRPEVKGAVRACREAGIRPVMITGDHPRTALAVARELGIAASEGEIVTGPEVGELGEEGLEGRVESVSVYARVSPEHKLRIVRAWRARGAVVAMTGDGVNDAPALKGADIGVAMGRTGTDVARDASAMVIADDNFATIVTAVEEGRTIFENIRKTMLYLLSGSVAEIAVMTLAVAAGWPLPFVPIQILWINLVTDGFPALALATDPADRDLLRQPPRRPGAEIADRDFLGWLASSAVLSTAVTVGAFLYGWRVEGSVERARTYAFFTLVMEEVLRSFAFRSRTKTLWEVGAFSNARLAAVAAATIGLQFLVHRSEGLRSFLKTGGLGWGEGLALLALSIVPVTVLEVAKLFRRARRNGGEKRA